MSHGRKVPLELSNINNYLFIVTTWTLISPARGEPCNSGSPPHTEYTFVTLKVYSWCMAKVRTNIEIEDSYVEAVMDRYGVRTKTEAVDLALRHLAGQPMSREEALAMRGAHAIGETPPEVAPTPAA